jgi:SAM-dependent methyltransferase
MTSYRLKPFQSFQGLKFPDESLIRHFFKNGLDKKQGTVLELGCGNGVNLGLYAHFGWEVEGLDFSKSAIEQARFNLGDGARLSTLDLTSDFSHALSGPYDALLLPSVLYYMTKAQAERVLNLVRPYLKSKAQVYWRMRTKADERYGKGQMIAPDSFILDIDHTGESGTVMSFYTKEELMIMAADLLDMVDILPLHLRFDNVQNGQIVRNEEIIIWGRIG